ncbi:hypothetical protein [Chelativorans sp. AA-79]|uniref:hypothetical protein n=1 Tax=Chelativorans sp. AA-79 TaxID=3028735 RepID=UPI0023F6E69F|nr:hypothetical protein [Chelativorans sp. AA-79]WEX10867.1 hypothetical protein PVE73_08015 [Chelativorans sp. AA-79]
MRVNDPITISGYVTKEKYVCGRTLAELERLLGFAAGRFSKGVTVAKPRMLPGVNDFETAGYSQVAEHRHRPPSGLDYGVLRRLARESWALSGPESLIKFLPNIPHADLDPDVQYPPGKGVPQWRIAKPGVPGFVVAEITGYPQSRYS